MTKKYKYKYYFKKPRSEIVKDIFELLIASGALVIAASSPYFALNIIRWHKNFKKYPKRKIYDTFYTLKRQGMIKIRKDGHQIYISLTEKGKKKAGVFQINSLEIKKPKRWDKKWRVIIFDISELKRTYREAFRGKLKELGFYPLQRSVWVHPFNCEPEVNLLKDFFGLSDSELRLMVVEKIDGEKEIKKFFSLL
jgi:DNA-binding transcriptional regulator PaaX